MNKLPSLYDLFQQKEVCTHCDQSIAVRNPTGYREYLNTGRFLYGEI